MTVLLVPAVYSLPREFVFRHGAEDGLIVSNWAAWGCICLGLWSGVILSISTEHYISNSYAPAKHLAESCEHGPAPGVIQGLALGYASCLVPALCLAAMVGASFQLAGVYGVGLAAFGALGALPVAASLDGYRAIAQNSGDIAEMTSTGRLWTLKVVKIDLSPSEPS